jgi:hypothetical protein
VAAGAHVLLNQQLLIRRLPLDQIAARLRAGGPRLHSDMRRQLLRQR